MPGPFRIGDLNGYPPGRVGTGLSTSWEEWTDRGGQTWYRIFIEWSLRRDPDEPGEYPTYKWEDGGDNESRSNEPIGLAGDEDAQKFVHGFYAQFFQPGPTSTGGVGTYDNFPWSTIASQDPGITNEAYADSDSYEFKGRSFATGGGAQNEVIAPNDQKKAREDFRATKLNGSFPKTEAEEEQEKNYVKDNAYKIVLQRTGIPFIGYKVRPLKQGPGGVAPSVGLFEAEPTDYNNRFDCITINGNIWCVFTNDEYQGLKSKLQQLEAQYKQRLNAGLTVSGETEEELEDDLERLRELDRMVGENFDRKYGKQDEPPNPEADLRLRIINAQACLILAMPKIVETTGKRILRTADVLSPTKNADVYPSVDAIQRVRHSKLISYDGNPNALLNLLANPFPITRFMDATPAELAHLQPRLQFFIDGRPIQFPDYTLGHKTKQLADLKASKMTTARRDEILKSRGMEGTDVGIKSFDWSLENKMEGNSTIKAELVLHFNSMAELMNEEYLDFIWSNRPLGKKKKQEKSNEQLKSDIDARIAEMKRSDNPTDEKSNNCQDPDGLTSVENEGTRPNRPSELNVLVGWAKPPVGNKSNLLTKEFRDAVERTQRLLRLNLVQYDINFNQKGSIDLNLSYIGGMDALLANPDRTNIFDTVVNRKRLNTRPVYVSTKLSTQDSSEDDASPRIGYDIKEHLWPQGYLYKMLTNPDNIQSGYGDGVDRFRVAKESVQYELKTLAMVQELFINQKRSQHLIDSLQNHMQAAKKVLEEINYIHKDLAFSSFIDAVISGSNLYYVTVSKFALNKKQYKLGQKVPYTVTVGGYNPASALANKLVGDRLKQAAENDLKLAAKIPGSEKTTPGKFLLDPIKTSECIDDDLESHRVNLFYIRLGDLIDKIMDGISLDACNEKSTREIIFGSFYPYFLGIPGTVPTDIYSISDIPISIDYLGHWFLKNYAAKQTVPRASLRRFIDDLMTDLVAPLFNSVLKSPNSEHHVGRLGFKFSTVVSPLDLPAQGSESLPSGGRLVGIHDIEKVVKARDLTKRKGEQKEYFVVGTKQISPELVGNRFEDEKMGIQHLIVGSDRGLVKQFNFSQVDLPFYKEMRIEQDNPQGALFLPQNVELVLVGNAFFRNGSQIFVNADFGLGDAAAKLGIGGYYTVVSVRNSIAPGKFETVLSAVFKKKRSHKPSRGETVQGALSPTGSPRRKK